MFEKERRMPLLTLPALLPPQTAYKEGEYIVRQGAGGDTFFIISKGRVSSLVRPFDSHSIIV